MKFPRQIRLRRRERPWPLLLREGNIKQGYLPDSEINLLNIIDLENHRAGLPREPKQDRWFFLFLEIEVLPSRADI